MDPRPLLADPELAVGAILIPADLSNTEWVVPCGGSRISGNIQGFTSLESAAKAMQTIAALYGDTSTRFPNLRCETHIPPLDWQQHFPLLWNVAWGNDLSRVWRKLTCGNEGQRLAAHWELGIAFGYKRELVDLHIKTLKRTVKNLRA